jgi:hypothetical protein
MMRLLWHGLLLIVVLLAPKESVVLLSHRRLSLFPLLVFTWLEHVLVLGLLVFQVLLLLIVLRFLFGAFLELKVQFDDVALRLLVSLILQRISI